MEEPSGSGTGVRVSEFDYSVENHFRVMDKIGKLCEESKIDTLDETDVQRFSSSVTFIREWKHFSYEPRLIKFASELPESQGKDVSESIELPQFSSAAVPKPEGLYRSNASPKSCKDFVMYVGGSVWAIDWCPRVHENPNSPVKCEFVAIAAHPPDSYYHKMGAPLTGRGIIQIWCMLNVGVNEEETYLSEKKPKRRSPNTEAMVEFPSKRPRGRPKKNPVDEPQSDQVKGPVGRPRKKAKDESQLDQAKRPVVRPKRKPISEPVCTDQNEGSLQLVVQNPEDCLEPVLRENSPGIMQGNAKDKNCYEKEKGDKEAEITSNASPQTSVKNRNLKCKMQAKTNSDGKGQPLLTQSEEREPSSRTNQVTEQETVMCNNVLDSVCPEVSPGDSILGEVALPRVALCLAHNGKVAWDVKWQPYDINDSKCNQRMGYLAVLLGNGSLEVWEIPLPHMIRNVYSSSASQGTDPRFVKLEPVFKCSKLKCGDIQSIPLTVEWSTSPPHDYLLAGCHDGMVALWKFSGSASPKDTRPLLCFSADTVPIRSVAWAPYGSDMESANVILTAGHGGLKFWDIRDPFLPLWDVHPAPKFIYSLDWLPEPSCVMLCFDDGTMRLLSLIQAVSDAPVTGKSFTANKQQGLHLYNCSSFAIWNVQMSRLTGMVAYSSADGTVTHFQLTSKAVEKDFSRNRAPHFQCGSLTEEESAIIVKTPAPDTPLPLKKLTNDCGEGPKSMRAFLSESNQAKNVKDKKSKTSTSDKQPLAICSGSDLGVESEREKTLAAINGKKKRISKSDRTKKIDEDKALTIRDNDQASVIRDEDQALASRGEEPASTEEESGSKIEVFPPKSVAMHSVRWNMNKGSERWLCYGGAAGIIRCQEIMPSSVNKSSRKC